MTAISEDAINQRFARFLRERLKQANNNEMPAVSTITARFNHIDNWQRPVSPETMRRWVRGLSLPELSRLPALCRLLACSPIDIVDAIGVMEMLQSPTGPEHSSDKALAAEAACEVLRSQVVEIMRGMDEPRLKAVVSLLERRSHPRKDAPAG